MSLTIKQLYSLLRWSNPWSVPEWNAPLDAHTLFQSFALSALGSHSTGKEFIQRALSTEGAPELQALTRDFEHVFAGDIREDSRFERTVGNNNPTTLCDWMVVSTRTRDNQFGRQLHRLLVQQDARHESILSALLQAGGDPSDALSRVLSVLPEKLDLEGAHTPPTSGAEVEHLSPDQCEEHEAVKFIMTAMPRLTNGRLSSADKLRRLEKLRNIARTLTVAVANLALSAPWRLLGVEPVYILAEGGRPGAHEYIWKAAHVRLRRYGYEHLDASARVVARAILPAGSQGIAGEAQLRAHLCGTHGATRRTSQEDLHAISAGLWAGYSAELEAADQPELEAKLIECMRQELEEAPSQSYSTNLRRFLRAAGLSASKRTARPAFEAEVLPILVGGLVSAADKSVPYATFVDELRDQLGIVVGIGGLDTGKYSTDERERILEGLFDLGPWRNEEELRRYLGENERRLEDRLVTSGLAKRFSDSTTEVFRVHR
jgi:hypothetical protein